MDKTWPTRHPIRASRVGHVSGVLLILEGIMHMDEIQSRSGAVSRHMQCMCRRYGSTTEERVLAFKRL